MSSHSAFDEKDSINLQTFPRYKLYFKFVFVWFGFLVCLFVFLLHYNVTSFVCYGRYRWSTPGRKIQKLLWSAKLLSAACIWNNYFSLFFFFTNSLSSHQDSHLNEILHRSDTNNSTHFRASWISTIVWFCMDDKFAVLKNNFATVLEQRILTWL